MAKSIKTNVMRILEQARIPYVAHTYEGNGNLSGSQIARLMGQDPARVYKTLVTKGKGGYFVFLVPVDAELNLKKAAAAAGEKAVSMLPQKELLPTTGYIHGGCSPLGMKKIFPTVLDDSVKSLDSICFSAGKIGFQVELNPADLPQVLQFSTASITE